MLIWLLFVVLTISNKDPFLSALHSFCHQVCACLHMQPFSRKKLDVCFYLQGKLLKEYIFSA